MRSPGRHARRQRQGQRVASAGGRSYGNTLGHFHENFGLEPLRKSMVNGILWTAHCEIPAGGAPCKISEEDMALEEPQK